MFASALSSAWRRAGWLGVSLLTAFLAAWVIGRFEATIQQLVALAILMPVVAAVGGIAGSQTLTIVVRGLALGQVSRQNAGSLLLKELSVGLFNGMMWATIVGLVAALWFDNRGLGIIIGLAMLINLLVAAPGGRHHSLDPEEIGRGSGSGRRGAPDHRHGCDGFYDLPGPSHLVPAGLSQTRL